jgi:hypothetical protein
VIEKYGADQRFGLAGIQKDFASQARNGFVQAAASFRQKK